MIDLLRTKGPGAVADQMLPKLLSASAREYQPDLVASVRNFVSSVRFRIFLILRRAGVNLSRRIRKPRLVVVW